MKTLLDPLELDPQIEWFDRAALRAKLEEETAQPVRRWAPLESWRPSRLWASDDGEQGSFGLRPLGEIEI